MLDQLTAARGLPEEVVLDNGPESIGRALAQWAGTHGVRLHFIDPGKPIQNVHIESVHGRFRDECLNESWFLTAGDAQRIIGAWRQDYNTERPHSSLDYLTPAEFERRWTRGTADQPAYGSRESDRAVKQYTAGYLRGRTP